MDIKKSTPLTPYGVSLPNNIDAEEAVLGSILIDGNCIRKVVNILKPEYFFIESNRDIFAICLDLFARHESITVISVGHELVRKDKIKANDLAYVSRLSSNCATSLDIETHARIVYAEAVSRKALELAKQVQDIGLQELPDAKDILNQISDNVEKFKQTNLIYDNKVISPRMAANDVIGLMAKYSEPSESIKWGFYALDDITSGIFPEYIVIGARPSIGKSQLMIDISENIALCGKKVLFVSAEMSKDQIYERKISRYIGLNILKIRQTGLTDKQRTDLCNLAGEVENQSVYYMAGSIYLNDIYRQVAQMKEKGDVDVVFVDYLGALRDCYVENKDTQTTRISRISNKFQSMVHEFNVPFVVASQLNREIEHGNVRPPQLSDLRDSGSIEQDADVVLLLHRDVNNGNISPELNIAMAKNRQLGMHKAVKLIFDANKRRYVDIAYREEGN